MIADFKWYMIRHRENFTKEGFKGEWNMVKKY